jgi:hypothetical protein
MDKNAAAGPLPQPTERATMLATASYGAGSIFAAGASGGLLEWKTTSNALQVVRQCTLAVPWDGQVFIAADMSFTRVDGDYEAKFTLGMDTANADGAADRWVNVYSDSGDGTDRAGAVSILKPVTAGIHTFYLLASRYGGTGTVDILRPTLTAVFIPSVNTRVVAAGASGNANWTTTSSAFQVVRQCTLTVPGDGQVFIAADTSLARSDGDYEARFSLGVDSTNRDSNIERWVNVYSDSGDGTDKSGALSILKPVTAGVHTFYLLATRYSGAGTVTLYDPSLTVIFTPSDNADVVAAGASGSSVPWTTTDSAFQVVRQCTLTAPRDGQVFIAANTSLARSDGDYEARFSLGVDTTNRDMSIERWVNVYSDSGDGTDENGALSILKPVAAGVHTFYLLAARYNGTGTVDLLRPTLTAIFTDGPSVPPIISAAGVQGGAFGMVITNLVAGTTNDILGAVSLSAGEWTTSATFRAASAGTNWSAPAPGSSRFYRVRSRW